jgi:glycine dehydrogenase subunit 1
MDYVQITSKQRASMLSTIGVDSIDDLYCNLPQQAKSARPLDLAGLPRGLSELELKRQLDHLAAQNTPAAAPNRACFLGFGSYDHDIPSVVDALASQGAFVTAYTPYQAEASQGSLQAFFEFQTQVCRLTGLDVANASLYEGATAVAEAVWMALNITGRRRVIVASTLHPHYLAVLRTYMTDLPVDLTMLPACSATGTIDPAAVSKAVADARGDIACLVIQSPNVFGAIEDWSALFKAAKSANTQHNPTASASDTSPLGIAVFNPIACGLLKRPGDCGADIAAADGQPLGIPMQFGGPYLGLFAARHQFIRKMPGRLVGQTTDSQGRRAFCLTLQTREQHIRGAKATSNICTNQGLLALRATIYLNALGPAGIREAASHCYHKAHHAAKLIANIPGYSPAYRGEFFHEFVVNCPGPARKIIDAGRDQGILAGLDCAQLGIGHERQLLLAVTEKRTAADIDSLIQLLRKVT